MDSTSRPTYPTSVNLVASIFRNGELARRARRRAISVLPTPVGPDHDDVLGSDFFGHLLVDFLPADAVAQGDSHGPLGRLLPHDIPVEFLDDLPRRHFIQTEIACAA